MTEFTDLDLYYMKTGEHTTLSEIMGARISKERNKILGTHFGGSAP
ncbi:hypothetical protein ACJBXE_10590 [Streptococcus suis]